MKESVEPGDHFRDEERCSAPFEGTREEGANFAVVPLRAKHNWARKVAQHIVLVTVVLTLETELSKAHTAVDADALDALLTARSNLPKASSESAWIDLPTGIGFDIVDDCLFGNWIMLLPLRNGNL